MPLHGNRPTIDDEDAAVIDDEWGQHIVHRTPTLRPVEQHHLVGEIRAGRRHTAIGDSVRIEVLGEQRFEWNRRLLDAFDELGVGVATLVETLQLPHAREDHADNCASAEQVKAEPLGPEEEAELRRRCHR